MMMHLNKQAMIAFYALYNGLWHFFSVSYITAEVRAKQNGGVISFSFIVSFLISSAK